MIDKTASAILDRAKTASLAPQAVARALLLHEDSYACVLLCLAMDVFGMELLEWHPATIKMEMERQFAVEMPMGNFDRLMAAILLVTSNQFFKSIDKFIHCCHVLSGSDFDPNVFEPNTPEEVLWGITEAMIIYPADDDKEDTEFSPEIRAYIAQILQQDGIAYPPDILRLGADPNVASRIDDTFADDPVEFEAMFKVQSSRRHDLFVSLHDNLQRLLEHFQILSLQDGNTGPVVHQLEKILNGVQNQVSATEEGRTV